MAALTRKLSKHRADCWQVHFGDVQVGTIARRSGAPVDVDQWGWICGFYPGSQPGEYLDGTAATFEQARADFEHAWRVFSAKRTPANYQLGAISATGQHGNMPCGSVTRRCRRSVPEFPDAMPLR